MVDSVSRATRSRIMRANKPSGTSPEAALVAAIKALGVRGFSTSSKVKVDAGKGRASTVAPDVVLRAQRVAVFVHGCFWHGCAQHYRPPATNVAYWSAKVARNRARDSRQRGALMAAGWRVVEVWEHEVSDVESARSAAIRVATAVGCCAV